MHTKSLNLLKIFLFVCIILLTGIALNASRALIPCGKDVSRLLREGGAAVVILLSYYFFMTRWDKIAPSNLSLYPKKGRFKVLCYGCLVGTTMLVTVFALNNLFHSILPVFLGVSLKTSVGIVLLFVTMFIGAVWEEVAFRGYFLQKLSETIGVHPSCFVVALSFGLLHLLSPLCSFQIVISTFLSGLLLNYAYFYSGNLYLPIGIHFGWNFFNGLLFSERIFKVEYLNTLLAGIQNPEQGLVAIVVTGLAASCFVFLYLKKQKRGR